MLRRTAIACFVSLPDLSRNRVIVGLCMGNDWIIQSHLIYNCASLISNVKRQEWSQGSRQELSSFWIAALGECPKAAIQKVSQSSYPNYYKCVPFRPFIVLSWQVRYDLVMEGMFCIVQIWSSVPGIYNRRYKILKSWQAVACQCRQYWIRCPRGVFN